MVLFNIGDRVTLAPARGGYDGFVTAIVGGPGGALVYVVQSPQSGDANKGTALVAQVDIATGPGAVPAYAIGEALTLYGAGAVVTADHGDGTYDVAIDWLANRHLTLTRSHLAVPAWRLALENGG